LRNKKGQIIAADAYIAIGIFLFAVIFFYSLIALRTADTDINKEADKVIANIMAHESFKDMHISPAEEQNLGSMNCSELKKLFESQKDICIYFEDNDGNIVYLDNNTKYGIGCPGINISGVPCGSKIN